MLTTNAIGLITQRCVEMLSDVMNENSLLMPFDEINSIFVGDFSQIQPVQAVSFYKDFLMYYKIIPFDGGSKKVTYDEYFQISLPTYIGIKNIEQFNLQIMKENVRSKFDKNHTGFIENMRKFGSDGGIDDALIEFV